MKMSDNTFTKEPYAAHAVTGSVAAGVICAIALLATSQLISVATLFASLTRRRTLGWSVSLGLPVPWMILKNGKD